MPRLFSERIDADDYAVLQQLKEMIDFVCGSRLSSLCADNDRVEELSGRVFVNHNLKFWNS